MKTKDLFFAALTAILFFCCPLSAQTQTGRIPPEVFYLLPEFADGTVYLKGQSPAQGRMNICAADNTLRYIDGSGKELSAGTADNIVMVQIGDAAFIYGNDGFYRKYPVTPKTGVAYQRNVHIYSGAKRGAYGTIDQTSSIRQYSSVSDGAETYDLSTEVPYEVNEKIAIYTGNTVIPLTRKNLKKIFPSKADEIKAWFKSGHSMPRTVEDARAMLAQWAD